MIYKHNSGFELDRQEQIALLIKTIVIVIAVITVWYIATNIVDILWACSDPLVKLMKRGS